MNIPDLEFLVLVQPHTTAGRKWLAERMMPRNDMFSGVMVRSVECANRLGDEAVAVYEFQAWSRPIRSRDQTSISVHGN
jgi:hypothetical protein